MNSQDFVAAIERYVGGAAVEGTIANLKAPPGRRVLPEVQERSDWYNGLSENDKERVQSVISKAAHATLFGFLAVLDGARTIDDENGRFELVYISKERTLLNPESIGLHDLLNSRN